MEELLPWPATSNGPPIRGSHPSMSSLRYFGTKPKKVAFHKVTIKCFFTIHEPIFPRPIKPKNISVGLRIIPVPTKIILDAFRNIFRSMIFISEKQPKWFRQLRNISGFYPGKFQKVSRMILAPSKNYQACAKTNLTLWYPLKQLFSFTGTHPVTSLRNFSAVRNFSGVRNFFGDFLSDSLSSIQQIDDP